MKRLASLVSVEARRRRRYERFATPTLDASWSPAGQTLPGHQVEETGEQLALGQVAGRVEEVSRWSSGDLTPESGPAVDRLN